MNAARALQTCDTPAPPLLLSPLATNARSFLAAVTAAATHDDFALSEWRAWPTSRVDAAGWLPIPLHPRAPHQPRTPSAFKRFPQPPIFALSHLGYIDPFSHACTVAPAFYAASNSKYSVAV